MKRAIITLAIGETFFEMGLVTHPLMKDYADRCSADFIVLDEIKLKDKLGLVTYEKFQIWEYLGEKYDQIIFIDTDIVISPLAPNLFEKCHEGVFGAANEEKYSMSGTHKRVTQDQLGEIEWINPYFNSGVMVVSAIHKELFDPNNKILQSWCLNKTNEDHVMSDQPVINYLVNYYNYEFLDLTYKYNRTSIQTDTHKRFSSYFIHYSGGGGHRYGERLKQIKADASVVRNPFNLWVSRTSPSYRWIADRCNTDFLKYLLNKFFKRN